MSAPPTLYEWMGGAPALEKLFDTFYRHVRDDAVLEPVFRHMDPDHSRHVAAWVGEVLGGPPAYSSTRGGHSHMVSRHVGRAITESQRRRWLALLLDTADEVGVPDDPEFRASLVGYLEWGSRLAVLFSAPGASPSVDEPMPTWDWAKPPWQPPAG
ncbi:group II truncated hemoglobin [Actinophytocola sp.]|jgi:hemoglobin|uniref:group II truncated hemoglobin n=1 Tax=Actinophytocola sp. TaxID=1872138 RepID=UPI002EDAAF6C